MHTGPKQSCNGENVFSSGSAMNCLHRQHEIAGIELPESIQFAEKMGKKLTTTMPQFPIEKSVDVFKVMPLFAVCTVRIKEFLINFFVKCQTKRRLPFKRRSPSGNLNFTLSSLQTEQKILK